MLEFLIQQINFHNIEKNYKSRYTFFILTFIAINIFSVFQQKNKVLSFGFKSSRNNLEAPKSSATQDARLRDYIFSN